MKQLLCATLILVAFSCKKKDSDTNVNTTTPTKEQIAGTYKQTGETYQGQNVWGGSASFYQPCEMDDTYTFNTNGTYNQVDAGVVCSSPNTFTGSWNVNGSTFTFDGLDWTIQSFSGGTLVIKHSQMGSGSTTYTTVATYQRQ